jgi:plastocyanin
MRTFFGTLVFLLLVSLVVAGCSSDGSNSYGSTSTGPSPVPSSPNTVQMSGMSFSPATLTVSAGTTVTWKNDDTMAHTSTSDTGAWDTGNLAPGASKTTTFATAGTFAYHCAYHAGMKGTVVVQ